MTRWIRWYEGTCEDGKFRVVARNASVTVATVMGVWAILLEDAGECSHRGTAMRASDFYCAVLDLEFDVLDKILHSMEDAGLIGIGENYCIIIHNWKKRQFETDKTDGTNAERQRSFRERQKEKRQRNGTVTATKRPDTESDTDTEKKENVSIEVEFEKFWTIRPGRGKHSNPKHTARKNYQKAVQSGVPPSEINAAARRWAEAEKDTEPQFVVMSATWLHQRRFEDYRPSPEDTEKEAKIAAFMRTQGKEFIDGKGWVPLEQPSAPREQAESG